MITVGMDVHVRNSYLHVTDDAGNVMRRGRCRNTLMDLAEFLGPIEREAVQRGEPVRAVLECTTNSRAIQRMLMEYGRACRCQRVAAADVRVGYAIGLVPSIGWTRMAP